MKNIKNLLLKEVEKIENKGNEFVFYKTDEVVDLSVLDKKQIMIALELDSILLSNEIALKNKAIKEKNFLSKIIKGEKVIVEKLLYGYHFIENSVLYFYNAETFETKKVSKITLENPCLNEDFLIENFPKLFFKDDFEEELKRLWSKPLF